MKEKLRSKSFWIGLISAVLIFVQALGLKVDVPAVNEIVSALLTVLVMLGIISTPPQGGEQVKAEEKDEEEATEK